MCWSVYFVSESCHLITFFLNVLNEGYIKQGKGEVKLSVHTMKAHGEVEVQLHPC